MRPEIIGERMQLNGWRKETKGEFIPSTPTSSAIPPPKISFKSAIVSALSELDERPTVRLLEGLWEVDARTR